MQFENYKTIYYKTIKVYIKTHFQINYIGYLPASHPQNEVLVKQKLKSFFILSLLITFKKIKKHLQ